MRLRKSLIGSFTEPFNGFREVFFYALAVIVGNPKVILRQRNSLNSGFTAPYDGFREIFFYAIAVTIAIRKVKLYLCMSLNSSFLVIFKSLIVFSVF